MKAPKCPFWQRHSTTPVSAGLSAWMILQILLSALQAVAQSGSGLALDNTNGYAQAPASASLNLGAGAGQRFTIEAFFYASRNPLGYTKLVSKPFAYELGLEFASPVQTLAHFTVWKTPDISGKIDLAFTIPSLAPGRHHIAATLGNSTNDNVRTLFLDGLSVITDSFYTFPSGLASSASPITVGGGGTNQFHGWIDEVRLSNIIRYTNDVPYGSDLPYRIPTSPWTSDSNTVALWHFDEPPGSTVFHDVSGNSNHLSSFNNVTTGPTPIIQSPGTIDQSFYPGLGAGDPSSLGDVHALGILTNGQVIIGGQFASVDGSTRTNLARLNLDGSFDSSFNVSFTPGLSAPSMSVNAVLILPNNQILIGGDFAAVNGTSHTALARLNQNGTLDTGFSSPLGLGDFVSAVVRQPDGKLVIFGSFSSIAGYFRFGAARLNSNGTIDPSFDASWAGNGLYQLKHIILQSDGKFLCAVSQYNFNTQLYTNIIRLNPNGTMDGSFQPVLSDQANNSSIALQADGKILLSGYFTIANGVQRIGAARFLTNGMLDTTFSLTNSGGTFYTNGGWLTFVAAQSNGKTLLGGTFLTGPGTGYSLLARFLSDGSFDPDFQSVQFYVPNNTVHDVAFQNSGKILIAGGFIDVNGYSRSGVARLYGDPTLRPRFLSITSLPGGVVRLDVTNAASQPLVLQTATNLTSGNWQTVATNQGMTSQCQFFDTNSLRSISRFYRTVFINP